MNCISGLPFPKIEKNVDITSLLTNVIFLFKNCIYTLYIIYIIHMLYINYIYIYIHVYYIAHKLMFH